MFGNRIRIYWSHSFFPWHKTWTHWIQAEVRKTEYTCCVSHVGFGNITQHWTMNLKYADTVLEQLIRPRHSQVRVCLDFLSTIHYHCSVQQQGGKYYIIHLNHSVKVKCWIHMLLLTDCKQLKSLIFLHPQPLDDHFGW